MNDVMKEFVSNSKAARLKSRGTQLKNSEEIYKKDMPIDGTLWPVLGFFVQKLQIDS